jgi:hypothetical protein
VLIAGPSGLSAPGCSGCEQFQHLVDLGLLGGLDRLGEVDRGLEDTVRLRVLAPSVTCAS